MRSGESTATLPRNDKPTEVKPVQNEQTKLFLQKFQPKRSSIKSEEGAQFRRMAKTIVSTIVIEDKPDPWTREEHGGLKMWVNEKSREVSLVRPEGFEGRRRSIIAEGAVGDGARRNSIIRNGNRRASIKQNRRSIHGTGNNFYDGKEMAELFSILDANSLKAKGIQPNPES
jgi:hypothetical protein